MDLVVEERELLEEYFLKRFPDTLMGEEAYHLLLLVLFEKPGVLVMSADKEQRELLEDFCEDTGLEMKIVEDGQKSLLDRILGKNSSIYRDSIYVARDPERFKILEASNGIFTGFSSRAVGEFLGYPNEAIDFYEEDGVPGIKFENGMKELIDRGIFSEEEVEMLDFLAYLPPPEKEDIQEALKVAENMEQVLHKLDSKLDTSIGEKYLREIKA